MNGLDLHYSSARYAGNQYEESVRSVSHARANESHGANEPNQEAAFVPERDLRNSYRSKAGTCKKPAAAEGWRKVGGSRAEGHLIVSTHVYVNVVAVFVLLFVVVFGRYQSKWE